MLSRRLTLASAILVAAACARAPNEPALDESGAGAGGDGSGNSGVGNSDAGSGNLPGGGGEGSSDGGTSAGGAGGQGDGGAAGGGVTTGGGGMSAACDHDVCIAGNLLAFGCDPCVDIVCTEDSYCCDTEWDDTCVGEAADLCGAPCMTGGGGPFPGDLIITEIMNNPTTIADASGEWFEIYNASANPIDLLGLSIRHQNPVSDPTAVETIGASVVVGPGGFVVLGINGDALTNGNITVDYVYSATVSLNNTSDYLAIEDAGSVILDEVLYDEASGLDPNGKSRSLDPLFMSDLDNDDDTYFCEATSPLASSNFGTPGSANDPCPP